MSGATVFVWGPTDSIEVMATECTAVMQRRNTPTTGQAFKETSWAFAIPMTLDPKQAAECVVLPIIKQTAKIYSSAPVATQVAQALITYEQAIAVIDIKATEVANCGHLVNSARHFAALFLTTKLRQLNGRQVQYRAGVKPPNDFAKMMEAAASLGRFPFTFGTATASIDDVVDFIASGVLSDAYAEFMRKVSLDAGAIPQSAYLATVEGVTRLIAKQEYRRPGLVSINGKMGKDGGNVIIAAMRETFEEAAIYLDASSEDVEKALTVTGQYKQGWPRYALNVGKWERVAGPPRVPQAFLSECLTEGRKTGGVVLRLKTQ